MFFIRMKKYFLPDEIPKHFIRSISACRKLGKNITIFPEIHLTFTKKARSVFSETLRAFLFNVVIYTGSSQRQVSQHAKAPEIQHIHVKDKSNITNPDTFLQRSNLILLLWNKFLTDETFITGFNDGFHYGRIIQFLCFIDFTASWRTAGMDM